MPNVTNHQDNANQNHNEISPHTCQNDYQSKSLQITNVGKDVEKREPSNIVGGNINWYSHCEKQYGGFSKKLKIELSYGPSIPPLDTYQEKKPH